MLYQHRCNLKAMQNKYNSVVSKFSSFDWVLLLFFVVAISFIYFVCVCVSGGGGGGGGGDINILKESWSLPVLILYAQFCKYQKCPI